MIAIVIDLLLLLLRQALQGHKVFKVLQAPKVLRVLMALDKQALKVMIVRGQQVHRVPKVLMVLD